MIKGTFLKKLREERGITVRTFASDVGIHPSVINKIERGLHSLSDGNLQKIASYLKIDPNVLYVGHHVLPPYAQRAADKDPARLEKVIKRATKAIEDE